MNPKTLISIIIIIIIAIPLASNIFYTVREDETGGDNPIRRSY